MTELELREAIKSAYKNRRAAGIRTAVNFTYEELSTINDVDLDKYVLDKIMQQLLPDTTGMSRFDIDCLRGNIPASFIEQIDSIEIESTIDEDTMAPQIVVCVRSHFEE